jgi:ATP phosphoribosyltransferase
MSGIASQGRLKIVLPKGRIHEGVVRLLNDAGLGVEADERVYRPRVEDPEVDVKIMKPQNIPQLVELGSHDAGFTGQDWIAESGADVAEIMDLELDPVDIVAAVPAQLLHEDLHRRKIVVASEYQNLARSFLERERYDFVLLRTYGATEVFPPEDADMIVDNVSTGRTLAEHDLRIIATLTQSSTRFIANRKAAAEPWKGEKIARLKMLLLAVLDARGRVMLEMNVPGDRLEEIVRILPCMRSPTVASLYAEQGYAVKVAVRREEVAALIPLLKRMGATDILEFELRKVLV